MLALRQGHRRTSKLLVLRKTGPRSEPDMTNKRKPLVLIPQYFGCLVFDRRTSRYLPFDREATDLLLRLRKEPVDAILPELPDADDRAAVLRFFECFYERGFFTVDGR